jgi:hypothetical protein
MNLVLFDKIGTYTYRKAIVAKRTALKLGGHGIKPICDTFNTAGLVVCLLYSSVSWSLPCSCFFPGPWALACSYGFWSLVPPLLLCFLVYGPSLLRCVLVLGPPLLLCFLVPEPSLALVVPYPWALPCSCVFWSMGPPLLLRFLVPGPSLALVVPYPWALPCSCVSWSLGPPLLLWFLIPGPSLVPVFPGRWFSFASLALGLSLVPLFKPCCLSSLFLFPSC